MKGGKYRYRKYCKGVVTIETFYFLIGSLLLISFLLCINKFFSEKALVERQSHSLISIIRDQKRFFNNTSNDLLKPEQLDFSLALLNKDYPNKKFNILIRAYSKSDSQSLTKSSFTSTCIAENSNSLELSPSWLDFKRKMLLKGKRVYEIALCSQVDVKPFGIPGLVFPVGTISFASSRE